jgi:hypothetical protein
MNKRIFLPAPVRLFSCSEMDEYDADGVNKPKWEWFFEPKRAVKHEVVRNLCRFVL